MALPVPQDWAVNHLMIGLIGKLEIPALDVGESSAIKELNTQRADETVNGS